MDFVKKVIQIGNSLGITIPKDYVKIGEIKAGDNLKVSLKKHQPPKGGAMLLFFLFLALTPIVHATECSETLTLDYAHIYYTVNETIDFSLLFQRPEVKNLDLLLIDPQGNRAVEYHTRFSNTSNSTEYRLLITDAMIKGNYSIQATVTAHNTSNITQYICEKSVKDTLKILTDRDYYYDIPLKLNITLTYPMRPFTACRTVDQGIVRYDVCTNGSIPEGYNINLREVVISNTTFNYSVDISPTEVWFNRSFVEYLIARVNDTTHYQRTIDAMGNRTAELDFLLNQSQRQQMDTSTQLSQMTGMYNTLYINYTVFRENPYGDDVRMYWGSVGGAATLAIAFVYINYSASRSPHTED